MLELIDTIDGFGSVLESIAMVLKGAKTEWRNPQAGHFLVK